MIPRWTSPLTGSTVYEADARDVAASLPAGGVSVNILDGPYGLGKAAWDRVPRGGSLVDLYRGHLEDVGRLSAQSASLYLWNTSAGWAELHPAILAAGWTFRALITWDKGIASMAGKVDTTSLRTWFDVTEVCGFYQREAWAPDTCAGQEIAYAAGRDERNWIRPWLAEEWRSAGLKPKDADVACDAGCMASRHYFPADQWWLPTWENWQRLAAYAQERGPARDRPYLVHPSQWPDGGLRATYDHLRAEYEASRPPFTCPLGVGNVWAHGQVAGPYRLKDEHGNTLHPCQKPLLFAERMIRASSRPGDTVWAPFGGTLRELVAAERIARSEPGEARRVVTCEINRDGVDYIGAALAQIEGRPVGRTGQVSLFGGGR